MNKLITILRKENLKPLLEKAGKNYDVYLPLHDKKNGIVDFYELSYMSEDYVLNTGEKTRKSPKFIFFPQTEKIFDFEYIKDLQKPDQVQIKLKEKTESSKKDLKKKILFGLKPCDTAGIKSLDFVFGEGVRKDPAYIQKRAGSILISIGCSLIYPDCFCMAVGGNTFNFEFSDIGLADLGDYFVILKKSENKEVAEFIKENKNFFEERDLSTAEETKIKQLISNSEEKCRLNWKEIDADKINLIMDKNFKDEKTWREVTNKCISCAACTYVCPTCVCFSIGDELRDMSGERYKCWDFCTNYYYTLEASGHNPRSEIYQRYRNKINCKYNYFYKRNKILYCVGCGRCVDVCPVGIDIREVVEAFL